jgi:dTDP-glucose 4,6-dehydratase
MNVREAPTSLSGLDDRDIAEVVQQAARFVDELRGARLLVTGATGWFGTWLLDTLVALDRAHALDLSIVAVSREPAAFAKKHPALHAAPIIVWHEADVRDSLIDLVGPFTHIIHAATEASAKVNAEAPDRMFETIIVGTTNVLKLAACHPQVKLLLVSSGAVYGAQPDSLERFDEDHPGSPGVLDPANAYAEGKRAAELLAAIWHAQQDVHVTIARCFAFVGPHMPFDAHFAVGNFLRDALAGKTIAIGGEGTPRRSYLYMTDLMIWLLAVLVDGKPMRPYNVGGEEIVTITELAERCIDAVAGDGDYRIEARVKDSPDYVPCVRRARNELGVGTTVALDESLRRTVQWKRARRLGVAA